MLQCTPENLREEVDAAIELRQKHIIVMNELVERYAGSNYRSDQQPEQSSIENHEFEFIVNTIPAVLATNPAVSVKSRRPVVQRELVQAMQHGINRWIKDIEFRDRIEPVLFDAFFKFGVMVVTMEPLPGHEHKDMPPLRPTLRRISPRMFFMDPQASGPKSARFMGHVFLRDRDDMLAAKNPNGSAKYDKEAIESLQGNDDGNDIIGETFLQDMDLKVDRDQVIGAEIYVPEKGMIYTIGFTAQRDREKRETKFIRKPRKAFCHPSGPYALFGFYIVPDQVYPLSPLCVTAESVEEANAHSEQIRRQASTARNLVLVDGTNSPLLDAIKNFQDGTVASIPNFDRNAFAEVAIGGPNPGQLDYVERLRERIDRRSGLTDIQRGQVSGDATATEAQLAAAAASGRVRYMQGLVRNSVKEILNKVGWLMFNSDSIAFPVSKEKSEKLVFEQNIDGTAGIKIDGDEEQDEYFFGGIQPGQEDFNYFDLELEIDPYSMEQVDEAVLQKRMEIATVTVSKFAPLMLQFPFVNWPELLDDYFQALNIPDGRKYINFELLAQILKTQFSPGAPQGIPGIDGAPPVDTGAFKGPPNMPAGSQAQQIAQGDPSMNPASEIASMLGAANSAA